MVTFIIKKGESYAASSQEPTANWSKEDWKQKAQSASSEQETVINKNTRQNWKVGDLCLVKTFGRSPKYILAYIVEIWGNNQFCRVRFADDSVPDVTITSEIESLRKP